MAQISLVLGRLNEVCQHLVRQGIANPLLTVSLHRRGKSIVVELDGQIVDPTSGQVLMERVARHADRYFDHNLLIDPDLAAALSAEVARFRRRGFLTPQIQRGIASTGLS
jgi:hypothetical protein